MRLAGGNCWRSNSRKPSWEVWRQFIKFDSLTCKPVDVYWGSNPLPVRSIIRFGIGFLWSWKTLFNLIWICMTFFDAASTFIGIFCKLCLIMIKKINNGIYHLGTLSWLKDDSHQLPSIPEVLRDNSYIFLPDEIASENKKCVIMMNSWMNCGWLDNSLWHGNNVKHLIHLKPNRSEGNVRFILFRNFNHCSPKKLKLKTYNQARNLSARLSS